MRVAVALLLVSGTARCHTAGPATATRDNVTLRIGFPEVGSVDALNGTRQLVQILSGEGLARIGEDGRPVPSLAESWTVAPNRLSMTVHLRRGVTFHDGTPADAPAVVAILKQILPQFMGPAFDDVDHLSSVDKEEIEIGFRRPSLFLLEALDAPIRKPGPSPIGTGAFIPSG